MVISRNKYRARKAEIDGLTFDSNKECTRYMELKLLVKAGEIKELVVHPIYRLDVNDEHICKYIADFNYKDKNGRVVVEDVKSPVTKKLPTYRLKKKLLHAIYGLDILET